MCTHAHAAPYVANDYILMLARVFGKIHREPNSKNALVVFVRRLCTAVCRADKQAALSTRFSPILSRAALSPNQTTSSYTILSVVACVLLCRVRGFKSAKYSMLNSIYAEYNIEIINPTYLCCWIQNEDN